MNKIQKIEIEKDVKFSNWNSFYTDLTIELAETRKLGYLILFNPKQVNHYYSKIINLYSTISWAIEKGDRKDIEKTLQTIEDNIFSTKYLHDCTNSSVTPYQRTIIKKLRSILIDMCIHLSDAGLLPKINMSQKDTRAAIVRNT